MDNSILCTIDFTESSRQTLQWAVMIAQKMNMPLTILYTYRLTHAQNFENVVASKKKNEEESLQKFQQFEKEFLLQTGIRYEFKTEIGFASDRIEDHAKKNVLNFLIMDKNITHRNQETFDELVSHIHVPLLLVP